MARDVLFAVRRSFITPFDRSDIRGLTNSLDDSIDQMQKTAKVMTLYEMRDFAPHMRQLGDIAVEAAALTVEAVALLPAMRKNHGRLNELTEQIARLESQSDDLYDDGMKALYDATKANGRSGDAMAFSSAVRSMTTSKKSSTGSRTSPTASAASWSSTCRSAPWTAPC